MQTITLAEVVSAGLKAYNEKRLTAQHPDRSMRKCRYVIHGKDGEEYCCVLGSAFNRGVRSILLGDGDLAYLNERRFTYLRYEKLVDVSDFSERSTMIELQQLHDTWCGEAEENPRSTAARDAEAAFVARLNLLEKALSDRANAATVGVTSA